MLNSEVRFVSVLDRARIITKGFSPLFEKKLVICFVGLIIWPIIMNIHISAYLNVNSTPPMEAG